MTRTQRLNLKKKVNRMTNLSLGMIGIFILNIVLLLTVNWRPVAMSDDLNTVGLLFVIIIVLLLMGPLMLAFSFNIRSTWVQQELYAERRRLYTERNKLYVRKVFDLVQAGKFDEAIDIHNNFVFGDVKPLTRGVLIGAIYYKGTEEQHQNAIKHMDAVVDEEM